MADIGNQDFPTTIGPDASFKGELTFEKGLRLMGRFEGKINTPGRLHIAREAKMQADVEAGAIVVEGDVRGNLTANDRIELKQTARYEGDLSAAKLVVDEGAVFSGHVTVGPDAVKGGNRPAGMPRPRVVHHLNPRDNPSSNAVFQWRGRLSDHAALRCYDSNHGKRLNDSSSCTR